MPESTGCWTSPWIRCHHLGTSNFCVPVLEDQLLLTASVRVACSSFRVLLLLGIALALRCACPVANHGAPVSGPCVVVVFTQCLGKLFQRAPGGSFALLVTETKDRSSTEMRTESSLKHSECSKSAGIFLHVPLCSPGEGREGRSSNYTGVKQAIVMVLNYQSGQWLA